MVNHLKTMNFKCSKCSTVYPELTCTSIESLPPCCKKEYLSFDHLHLEKISSSECTEIGTLCYFVDAYGNTRIHLVFEMYNDNSPLCLCDAEKLLEEWYGSSKVK